MRRIMRLMRMKMMMGLGMGPAFWSSPEAVKQKPTVMG
jgi:hypothetical protein